MSLTPRETSSGLRRPRLAAPAKCQPQASAQALLPVPPANPAETGTGPHDASTPPFPKTVPTREHLRANVRSLKKRRVVPLSETSSTAHEVLSAAIRTRTEQTLKQAHSDRDGADTSATREMALARQRKNLEDLRRSYDTLHAELVVKEEAYKALQIQLIQEGRFGFIPAAEALPLSLSISERTHLPSPRHKLLSSVPSTPADSSTAGSVVPGMTNAFGETAADKLRLLDERIGVVSEELSTISFNCDILDHVEWRTNVENHKREGKLQRLKERFTRLQAEAAELVELHDEALLAKGAAERELNAVRNAMLDRQRAYEECKQARAMVRRRSVDHAQWPRKLLATYTRSSNSAQHRIHHHTHHHVHDDVRHRTQQPHTRSGIPPHQLHQAHRNHVHMHVYHPTQPPLNLLAKSSHLQMHHSTHAHTNAHENMHHDTCHPLSHACTHASPHAPPQVHTNISTCKHVLSHLPAYKPRHPYYITNLHHIHRRASQPSGTPSFVLALASQVMQEQKHFKQGHEIGLKKEAEIKLDTAGELDAEGEQRLRENARDINKRMLQTHLLTDNSGNREGKLEEQYTRLRLASHNPHDIETPQDMMHAMLSLEERTQERRAQAEAARHRSDHLAAEHARLDAELQRVMFFGSASQALAEVERSLQPAIEVADANCLKFRARAEAVKRLTTEAKLGLSLLLNLCAPSDEAYRHVVQDSEVPASFDKIERHLLTCLSLIQMHEQEALAAARRAELEEELERASERAEEHHAPATEDMLAERAAEAERAVRKYTRAGALDAGVTSAFGHFNIRVKTEEEHEAMLEAMPSEEDDEEEDDGELHLTRQTPKVKSDRRKTGSKGDRSFAKKRQTYAPQMGRTSTSIVPAPPA